jgi:hypothetical protein
MSRPSCLSIFAAGLLLSGCISPEGWTRSVWSKSDLVAWYNEYEPVRSNLSKFGYAGSDEGFHHFITRPVDSFFMPKIPRSELTVPDERPRAELGRRLYFYLVDPRQDFRKVSEN